MVGQLAGIQMSDKPYFVKYKECIPLHAHGKRGMKPIPRPLNRLRNTVEKAWTEHGQNTLVYVCPLHTNGNHFSLLEINERERKIYHYDSKADPGVINGRVGGQYSSGEHGFIIEILAWLM